jgi:DNA polymerase-1
MIVTEQNFEEAIATVAACTSVVADVETDGLDPHNGNRLFSVGISTDAETEFYFPFRHLYPGSENLPESHLTKLISILNQMEELVGYNFKFDLHMMMLEGLIPWPINLVDVMVLVRMTEMGQYTALGLTPTIDRDYGPRSGDYDRNTDIELRKNKYKKNYALAPISLIGPYCEEDTFWTRKERADRELKIIKTKQEEVWKTQQEFTKVLLRMEKTGIAVDHTYGKWANQKIIARREVLEQQIYKDAGEEFLISSPKQIGEMFAKLDISCPQQTEKGNDSWDVISLAQVDHPLGGMISEFRTLEKRRNTYLEPFLANEVIHTFYKNYGTITGRLSSAEPAVQTIPRGLIAVDDVTLTEEEIEASIKRVQGGFQASKGTSIIIPPNARRAWARDKETDFTDDSEDFISIRRMFVPRPGYRFVSFDYSQMEVRVFLAYINNPAIFEMMKKTGFDFHTEAAKIAFKVDEEHPQFKYFRQLAKGITFGLIFGIGLARLSGTLNMSLEDTKEYRRIYFAEILGSEEFISEVRKRGRRNKFVTNLFGRRYSAPVGEEYKLVNYLIQGSSADLLTEKMIELDKKLEGRREECRMLLQIHDEILCEIREDKLDYYMGNISTFLEQNNLGIPMEVDAELVHPSWAHKAE